MADPAVWITGTGPDKQLNFRLPTGGKGDKGDKGDKGADGANVLPTDTAIANAINASGSATKTALSATTAQAITDAVGVTVAPASVEATIDSALTLATRGIAYGLRPVRKMIGFFGKAGHGWTGTGGTINLNDTSRPLLGTQSIGLTPAANGSSQVDKTVTAFNATKSSVRVTFRYTGNITSIVIYLASDTGLANRMQRNVLSTTAYLPDTDYTIDVPLSEFNIVTGTPDAASIVFVRILTNAGAAGGTLWVGQIALTDDASALAPNGLVTLSFDDSNIDHYNVARPKMAEYGMAGTIYPQINNIGAGAGFMTLDQMKFLQNIHGWDFGSHAYDAAHHTDHVGKDEAWLRAHFESIIQWMKDNDFRGSSFAWPNTTSDTLAQRIAADYFSSGRGGGSMADTLPPTQPYRTRAYNAGSYTLAQLQANIDTAKNVKGVGWCHIFFHSLPTTKVNANDFAKADFDALIDYIAASGMKVVTASQAMKLAATV